VTDATAIAWLVHDVPFEHNAVSVMLIANVIFRRQLYGIVRRGSGSCAVGPHRAASK
jgi:hypothetical protein